MKLEVGKSYKTRLGHKAFVFSLSGHPQEAIGFIELKSTEIHWPATWFIDGSFYLDKSKAGNDIVAEWTEPKPPQYVPYTWGDREELRGRWYRKKGDNTEFFVNYITRHGNGISIGPWRDVAFLADCEWLDGTPCGKKVES